MTKDDINKAIKMIDKINKEREHLVHEIKIMSNPFLDPNEVWIVCGEKCHKMVFESFKEKPNG